MNLPRVLLGVVLRSLVIVAVIAAYVAAIARSESTDALGAGLLAFLILVAIAFVWAVVDGVRRGLLDALLTWVLTSVLAGVGIPVALALTDDRDLASEVADGVVFFAVVLLVPAVLGLALGGLVHRIRRPAAAASTG